MKLYFTIVLQAGLISRAHLQIKNLFRFSASAMNATTDFEIKRAFVVHLINGAGSMIRIFIRKDQDEMYRTVSFQSKNDCKKSRGL